MADPRIWDSLALDRRRIIVLTAPSYEISSQLSPIARRRVPNAKRFAVIDDPDDADRFRRAGLLPVVEAGQPNWLDTATAVLTELGADADAVAAWARRQRKRATGSAGEALVVA